jgi:LacI family transcriptional regulator
MTRSVDDDYIRYLNRRRIPFVLLDREISEIKANCVLSDHVRGAYSAVEHLVQHGHRQVAFISGPADSPDSSARFDGYRQCLQDHGLAFSPQLVEHGDFRQLGGYQAMKRLLDSLESFPTAVFAANDEMAIGAIGAARDKGLRIPDDVAIAGYDDIEMAAFAHPPLTTIRQPLRDFGISAVQMLLRSMDGSEPETVVMPVELIVRRSCGCAS